MDERSRRNGYALFAADRADKERAHANADDPAARFALIADDRALLELTGKPLLNALFGRDEATGLGAALDEAMFLGRDATGPLFAAAAPKPEDDRQPAVKAIDMRSIATQGLLGDAELALVGTAKSLIGWHARHRFCANCGAPTQPDLGGWRRHCQACGALHFPRVDPVVIMLAVDGDKALLARSPHFIPGMYSALAGFIEPGETIEDAVRRELHEEAGIRTGAVRYHSSQPWPFPSSLMIGCFARADTIELAIDVDEIEAADWFSRTQIAAMLAHRSDDMLFAPPPSAIAHQLMKSFVDGEDILPG